LSAADRLDGVLRTEAVIDLAAIRGNVATLKAATSAEVMAVVQRWPVAPRGWAPQ
jgi:hypothetical protein